MLIGFLVAYFAVTNQFYLAISTVVLNQLYHSLKGLETVASYEVPLYLGIVVILNLMLIAFSVYWIDWMYAYVSSN